MSATDVNVLALKAERAETEVNRALDRGDQRAFRVWCKRRNAVVARLADLLVRIATG